MSLNTTFQNAAETIFRVFKSITYQAVYVAVHEDGFGERTESAYDVDVIVENFAERDVQFLSFSPLIQPTDVKGLIRGRQLREKGLTADLSTEDVLRFTESLDEFSIIAHSTDPVRALYTLLLRKN